MGPQLETMLPYALSYAEHGYRIFPCHHPKPATKTSTSPCSCGAMKCKVGKHPMISAWTEDASADPDQITFWWSRRPYANIGMLTGAPNGFDVLDEDPKDGGDIALRERVATYGELPPTPQSRTGSGGDHFFFNHHSGLKNNNKGKIAKGLDFRTNGGQVIVPPSLHFSGNRYEWVTAPDKVFAEPPAWLLAAMRKTDAELLGHRDKVPIEEWQRLARGVSIDERHNAILSIAGLLLTSLESKHLAIALTHAYNLAMCEPPKEGTEVTKIINFILRKRLKKDEI